MNLKMTSSTVIKQNTGEYSSLLRIRNCKYIEFDQYYLQVGTIKKTQGWIIHVSSIASQTSRLLNLILPELIKSKIAFRVIRNESLAHLSIDGRLGYHLVGKILSIYPDNDNLANEISIQLVEITCNLKGPDIPTDAYLGGTVYTRYGSFNPIIIRSENGSQEKYIHDVRGNIIKDSYKIPFEMPQGITWPFKNSSPPPIKSIQVLNNTYLVTSQLKGDVKGRVFKAIRLKGWNIKLAVVKEAKHDQSVDQYGRDITDRLRWQYEIQKNLHQSVALPKAYDFFEENGNSYLGMEYIGGELILNFLNKQFEGVTWHALSVKTRLVIIDYVIQILSIISKIHKLGYIHRDISPVNFIIRKNKTIVMIDLEGAYSLTKATPNPPYVVVTPGFTSPEQKESNHASIKSDVYSLGALIFYFFTGLTPGKFLTDHKTRLTDNLSLFDLDKTIHNLILNCLHDSPQERPALSTIIECLQQYRVTTEKENNKSKKSITPNDLSPDEIKSVLTKGLNSYDNDIFLNNNKLWHTITIDNHKTIINRHIIKGTNPSIFSGVSGGIYLLSKAKIAGLSVSKLGITYSHNIKFIQQELQSKSAQVASGLYFGKFGIAKAMINGIASKMLSDSTAIKNIVYQCLNTQAEAEDLTIVSGIAGQCIAILQGQSYLNEVTLKQLLDKNIGALIDKQRKDGSWPLKDNILYTGLERGMAGITLSLIQYYNYYPSSEIKQAITKGFEWLEKQTVKCDGINLWRASNKDNTIDPWLNNGITGIALCYLLADKILSENTLRKTANVPLEYLSSHLTQGNFSLANGLTGLGEVYLEANQILNTDQYQQQANRIITTIMKTRYEKGNTCHWIVDDEKEPDGGLMTGNGGILHYMLRYQHPGILGFPMFG